APRHRDRLVDRALAEPSPAPAEQPELPVGPETTMTPPPAPEDIAARHPVAVVGAVRGQQPGDLLAQLGGHLLVRVHGEDPVAAGLGEAEVLLRGEAGPRPNDDAIREVARDLRGLVLRLGVDHDDLVRPCHALQAGAQPVFLVERDDDHGEPGSRHRARISAIDRNTGSTPSAAMTPCGAASVRWIWAQGASRSAEGAG